MGDFEFRNSAPTPCSPTSYENVNQIRSTTVQTNATTQPNYTSRRLSKAIVLLLSLRCRRLLLLPLCHGLLCCASLGLLLDEGSYFLLVLRLLLGSMIGSRRSWPGCGLTRPNNLKSARWASAFGGSSRRPLHHGSSRRSRSSGTRRRGAGWGGRPGEGSDRWCEGGCGMVDLRHGGRSRYRCQHTLDRRLDLRHGMRSRERSRVTRYHRLDLGSEEERGRSLFRGERSRRCREERRWRRREVLSDGQWGRSWSRPDLRVLWCDDDVRIPE